MYRPPILGFDEWRANPSVRVQWKDGTVICRGILFDLSPETIARDKAEREHKQQLRDQRVVILEDFRNAKED